jgi:WS/DGAT/MGAT family acyltransferase
MNHLSALDALFLYLETPETPMHVGSLILFEKPKGHRGSFYPNVRRHIEARMPLAALFTRRLAFMPFDLTNPIWVDADHIDLDWHIRSLTLPKPGTQQQLEAAVAKLHEGMLDRDRPLWQFTLIEGLQNGQVAFYAKLHHAGMDGQGGVALAHATLDADPRGRDLSGKEGKEARLPPSAAKMLSAAFRNTVAQYGKIVSAVPDALKAAGAMGAMALSSSQAKKAGAPSEQLAGIGDSFSEIAGNAMKLKRTDTPLQAVKKLLPKGIKLGPRTSLNVAIGPRRSFQTVKIPLAGAKAIARQFDSKLNDVVLATCAGALRRFYAKDNSVSAKDLIAAVPASLRAPGDTTQNNQVTMMLVDLATRQPDPVKRMQTIRDASTKAKMLTGASKGVMSSVTDLPSLGIPWLMSIITPLYKSAVASNRIPVVANIIISNVPGPPIPLYMAGAAMRAYYPVSIVTHGQALNITIHSYAGSLDYGLIACKKSVPGLSKFAKNLLEAHQELLALVKDEAPLAPNAKPAVKVKPKTAAKPKARLKPKTKAAGKPTPVKSKPARKRA